MKLAIVGPTASGKSVVAMAIARACAPDIELVSVDSMQVYRGMDIGTAKPSAVEQAEVPHHLIDVADPDEDFTVTRFQQAVGSAQAEIVGRGRRPVLVGGTGLYFRAVIDRLDVPGRWPEVVAELDAEPDTLSLHRRLAELDPVAAGRMEPANRRRVVRALEVTLGSGRPFSSFGPGLDSYPPSDYFICGLNVPREALALRIEARLRSMLECGFVEEVERLAARPAGISRTARQALGYREVLRHVEEGEPLDACIEEAVRRTRRFARRQQAWFRRDPRITWYDASANSLALVPQLLGDWRDRCRP